MKKLIAVVALVALVALSGCGAMKAYLPVINASLLGGKGIAEVTKAHTVTKQDAVGCYVTSALITALQMSQVTVNSWAISSEGDKIIPGADVDLSACHAMMGGDVKSVIDKSASAKVQGYLKTFMPTVVGVLGAVLESNDVTCRDLALVKGVLEYVQNAAPVVVAELADPDGKMSLPSVTIKLAGCDVSSPAAAPRASAPSPCK